MGVEILEHLGRRGENNYYLIPCSDCGKPKTITVSNYNAGKALRCRSCGTKANRPKPLPKYVNGIEIVKDLGYAKGSRVRRVIARCPDCGSQTEKSLMAVQSSTHKVCIYCAHNYYSLKGKSNPAYRHGEAKDNLYWRWVDISVGGYT